MIDAGVIDARMPRTDQGEEDRADAGLRRALHRHDDHARAQTQDTGARHRHL
jgi:hypothetical protein